MISNERQYRATQKQRQLLIEELERLLIAEVDADRPGEVERSTLANRLMRASLEGQIADLDNEVQEYEMLRSGQTGRISATSLADIPTSLIKARIAAGMTQRELADRLGLKEQQIQRYESDGYAAASVTRLEEVMRALSVGLDAGVELPAAGSPMSLLRTNLARLGYDRPLIEKRFLREAGDHSSMTRVMALAERIARVLGLPSGSLLSTNVDRLAFQSSARFKAPRNAAEQKLIAYARYAEGIAEIVLRATAHLGSQGTISDARTFRTGVNRQLVAVRRDASANSPITSDELFVATLRYLRDLRIPVIPLGDAGAFHGACFSIEGRAAIVINSQGDSSSRWVNDLVHEARHAMDGGQGDTRTWVELGEIGQWNADPEEIEANNFAADVLFEGRARDILERSLRLAGGSIPRLKETVPVVAQQAEVPADVLANYLAYQLSETEHNWWPTAVSFHIHGMPWRTAVDELLPMIQFSELDHVERAALMDTLAS